MIWNPRVTWCISRSADKGYKMSAAVPFLPMSPALEGIPGEAFSWVFHVQLHVAWISQGSFNTHFWGDQTLPMSHIIVDTAEFWLCKRRWNMMKPCQPMAIFNFGDDIFIYSHRQNYGKKKDFVQQILSGEKKRVVRLSDADFFHNSFFFHNLFFPYFYRHTT